MNKDQMQQEKEIHEENLTTEKEEIENLLKAIEELEKTKQKSRESKPRNLISIEFGGVFHHNIFINFIFSFILNFTLIYLVIEIFRFAEYTDIIYIIILAFTYTFFETFYKTYVLLNHFSFVIKSMGFVFFFGYVAIFYTLDVFVFGDLFSFYNEALLIAFVSIFTIVRYIIGNMLIKNFRKRNLR